MDYEVFLSRESWKKRRAVYAKIGGDRGPGADGRTHHECGGNYDCHLHGIPMGSFLVVQMLGFTLAVAVFMTRQGCGWWLGQRYCNLPAIGMVAVWPTRDPGKV